MSSSSPRCLALRFIETWIAASKRRHAFPSLSGKSLLEKNFDVRFFLLSFALFSQPPLNNNKTKPFLKAIAPTPWSSPGPPQKPPKLSRCSSSPSSSAAARGRSYQEKKRKKRKMKRKTRATAAAPVCGPSTSSPGGTRRGGCWSAPPRPLPSRSPTAPCFPSSSRPLAPEPHPPWPRSCRSGRPRCGCRRDARSRRSPTSPLPLPRPRLLLLPLMS